MRTTTFIFLLCFLLASTLTVGAQQPPAFRMLAVAEIGEIHQPYVDGAKIWLNKLATDNQFAIDWVENPNSFSDATLAKYQVIFLVNYTPYRWTDVAKAAFEKYIQEGKGGWIGVHHASLLGEFDGHKMWPWFSEFLGGIRWKDYIAGFASGKVVVEAPGHPVMKGIPAEFIVTKDEWYTWDKSPRGPNIKVLANVDESTYTPPSDKKMGDHPVIWTNEKMAARNIYIFMGHDPSLFQNSAYTMLLKNSIFWAAGKN